MNTDLIPKIIEELIQVVPALHKKMFKVESIPQQSMLSQLQYIALGVLARHGKKTPTELIKPLFISKPQMTVMLDRLAQQEYIDRKHSLDDRRNIEIEITSKGREVYENFHNEFRSQMADKLLQLSDEDLRDLEESGRTLNKILSKIQ